MGIILVLVVLMIIGILMWKMGEEYDGIHLVGTLLTALASMSIGILLLVTLCFHATVDGEIAKIEMIRTQIESSDDKDIRNTGLMLEAIEINKNILQNQIYINNFWTNIFNSQKLSELELIIINK